MNKPEGEPGQWRNRIVGAGTAAPDQLLANPQNFRLHPAEQQAALDGVLNAVGVIQNIIVNKRTDTIIDGHLRVMLALRSNQKTIPVVYVDLSEDEERLALATLDPISALAVTDQEKLDELLSGISEQGAGIQALLDSMRSPPPRVVSRSGRVAARRGGCNVESRGRVVARRSPAAVRRQHEEG